MDNNFSWMQIHVEGDRYVLYQYNQKGLKKPIFGARDLERVINFMERRNQWKEKIGKAIAEAIEELKNNPAKLEALKKAHAERTHHA